MTWDNLKFSNASKPVNALQLGAFFGTLMAAILFSAANANALSSCETIQRTQGLILAGVCFDKDARIISVPNRDQLTGVISSPIKSLRGIQEFKKLEQLHIRDLPLPVRLSPLRDHPTLRDLSIKNAKYGVGLHEILPTITNLRSVSLSSFEVGRTTFFNDLTDIEAISIIDGGIFSIASGEPGDYLKLRRLAVPFNPNIRDVNFVRNMSALEYLNLEGTNVRYFDELEKLPRLETLILPDGKVLQGRTEVNDFLKKGNK